MDAIRAGSRVDFTFACYCVTPTRSSLIGQQKVLVPFFAFVTFVGVSIPVLRDFVNIFPFFGLAIYDRQLNKRMSFEALANASASKLIRLAGVVEMRDFCDRGGNTHVQVKTPPLPASFLPFIRILPFLRKGKMRMNGKNIFSVACGGRSQADQAR